jgi:hypothetical protein
MCDVPSFIIIISIIIIIIISVISVSGYFGGSQFQMSHFSYITK